MVLASAVHNGLHIPLNFDHSHRFSHSPSPPPSKFSASALKFVHCPVSSFYSVFCCRRAPVLGCKRTDKDDVKRTRAQPNEDSSNIETSKVTSIRNVVLWVCAAVAFGVGLGFKEGIDKASEFFAGYVLEQSLSVDNLFVFVLIFQYFNVPIMYQNRVLSYGIAGAVIFRLTLILLGTATLQRFEAVNLFLAAILLYSSIKLFASEEDESDLSNNYVVKTCQKFIPVTTCYDGNRFITNQDGVWKGSNILGRLPHCFLL